jgi:hypothetical protein
MAPKLDTGVRVKFSAPFLRSTGQYAGPDAPTSEGPWARGTVSEVRRYATCPPIVAVEWDNGRITRVLAPNLERCR